MRKTLILFYVIFFIFFPLRFLSVSADFTNDVNNIQGLGDRPNEIDGMTSAELKAKFDKAGSDIKEYINGTLIQELEPILNNFQTDITTISGSIPTDYVHTDDARLTNSRQCNNSFDSPLTARQNLRINYGTSLPSEAEDGDIFFLI